MKRILVGCFRGSFIAMLPACLLFACSEASKRGVSADAGGAPGDTSLVSSPDTRLPEPDTRAATDAATTPRPDTTVDQRTTDLAPTTAPDGPTASETLPPPNNGSVNGLTLIASNTTVGLDWPRVAQATKYRVYWATTPGVGKSSQALESTEPSLVHRGLTNGTTYFYAVAPVTAEGEGALSAEANAMPGGEWVLEELGAGDFTDVMTGGRINRLAVKDRIHVMLVGEGYLESELPKLHDLASHAGTRANDVDRWVDEVFAIEPYLQFRPAFVVWYLPRASAAHLGAGTTAFGVTIANGAVGTVTAAAAPIFSALDTEGTDAFAFPPVGAVVNHIAAFLLYDPARGRAGVSGMTTSLTNPTNRNQRIGAAFGIGHAHEFTHAFSNLRDEYLETNNTVRAASETGNTSPTNTCGTLPWAHLLLGAGINTTDGLVGAFGTPELGYHSELKCLMNGTHDNGQFFCAATSTGTYPTLTLRTNGRMCNFCREITAYRVFDRARILPGTAGFATWKSQYRAPFYQRFDFKVPTPVPQTLKCPENTAARPVFQACVP